MRRTTRLRLLPLLVLSSLIFLSSLARAKDLILDAQDRDALLQVAQVWFPDREALIPTRDVFNGPPNPYNFTVGATIDCDFIEPDPSQPEGGVTPKFMCMVNTSLGPVPIKFKYDQRFNSQLKGGKANNEVRDVHRYFPSMLSLSRSLLSHYLIAH